MMTEATNKIKKDRRTEILTEDEIQSLRTKSEKSPSFSSFSIDVRVERTALINTLARGSASPATVRKIRKYLQSA